MDVFAVAEVISLDERRSRAVPLPELLVFIALAQDALVAEF